MTGRRLVMLGALVIVVVAAGAVAWLRPAGLPAADPSVVVSTSITSAGDVTLEIEVYHLRAGEEYLARLFAVEGGQVSASAGTLGRFVADAEGIGRLGTATVTIGAGAAVPLTADLLAPPGALLQVVSSAGEIAASVTVTEGTDQR